MLIWLIDEKMRHTAAALQENDLFGAVRAKHLFSVPMVLCRRFQSETASETGF